MTDTDALTAAEARFSRLFDGEMSESEIRDFLIALADKGDPHVGDPHVGERRFIDLEIRLTYQEASIQELEAALQEKDKQMRTLEERVRTLEDFIREQMRNIWWWVTI